MSNHFGNVKRRCAELVPSCPFWADLEPKSMVHCENGEKLFFETKQEKREHMRKYCANVPDWNKCPVAKEILKHYN